MIALTLPWGFVGALFLSQSLLGRCGSASPAVSVELNASFNSPPYLLELLETAAEENDTAYYPLLDRIAEGYFATKETDEQLYKAFLDLLKKDDHITDAETLSSFQLALSIHSAAPRIEAHYQFYEASVVPSIGGEYKASCPVWHQIHGLQHCEPGIPYAPDTSKKVRKIQDVPFDRTCGNRRDDLQDASIIILYADITSPKFGEIYRDMVQKAKEGSINYRVRYRPPVIQNHRPLTIAGYGVELALKKTDYIVIDDRDAEKPKAESSIVADSEASLEKDEEEVADLGPLSTTELSQLGLKAASFVLSSSDPFNTLIKLVQDFPKHSSLLAAQNVTEAFRAEFLHNRELSLPAGSNAIWINGLQLDSRQVDPFALLEHLRRERKLVIALKDLGLSGPTAVKLLSYDSVSQLKQEDEPQRYDFRDEVEGGNVIIWLNDIEKDKRYKEWSPSLSALLQRTYPGQLPQVKRDIHNLIMPMDFSDRGDIEVVVETLQTFVKRKVPVRFGLVPLVKSDSSTQQAKVVYHLLEAYGISAVLRYLEACYEDRKSPLPNKLSFSSSIRDRKLRGDKTAMTFEQVLKEGDLSVKVDAAMKYATRLGANTEVPPVFVNGAAIPRSEEWFAAMSTRVTLDLHAIQRGVFEGIFDEDSWIPTYFLFQAAIRRNTLIVPEDESSVHVLDIGKITADHKKVFLALPKIDIGPESAKENWLHVIIVGDFDSEDGRQFLLEATQSRDEDEDIELVLLHNPKDSSNTATFSTTLHSLHRLKFFDTAEKLEGLLRAQGHATALHDDIEDASNFWASANALIRELGFAPGQQGLIVNGRPIGPIPQPPIFGKGDFKQLFEYERAKRMKPAYAAAAKAEILEKIKCPLTAAKLSALLALSTISEVPHGIFEAPSTARTDAFNQWKNTHSTIQTGDMDSSIIQIVATIDPASELAQRWIPILKVLAEIKGVYLRMYLNPRETLQELPVKRFYRYVLAAGPSFENDGSLIRPQAQFTGIPHEALLTVGMDVSPSWLVAPKECTYDLDNIRLSSLKDRMRGSAVHAVYELEHILIEGHSRDLTTGQAPRGVQLVLGTDKTPHFADTIIMANLGYFQFKANPGLWKLSLEAGRSKDIFDIESAGTKGYRPKPGDNNPEIELTSFQGKTLFPRLARKPGRETEDVLQEIKPKSGSAMDYVSKGFKFAEGVLSNVGLGKTKQADINIFSVASGHLYERMLNIMMVSVTKHTKHTVKFWFIEQFLSPSFKDFIPIMAEEYGFQYEMVTYQWPHWLRGQKEKQREIWGYKILFLDVLFPLSLDKVIFVDADQIVRADMYELVSLDLKGAPYGFTPMCDSRTEMEGFRFWKQGYWKNFLRGLPYHISALYVVDLKRFRQIAAGDRLRQQYHTLSADPNSLSNLDQDLPNHMQSVLPIHSLPQNWLWCETWCSDESLKEAKTIDLCNNPMTKEPKLDRARRQVPEWNEYDEEIAALAKRRRSEENNGGVSSSMPTALTDPSRKESSQNPKSRSYEENIYRKKDEL